MPDLNPVAVLWAAVVLTMSGLVVAALWPVPPRRAALVLVGPVVIGVVLFATGLGLVVVAGMPYLLLLVPPILPWRKEWARFAMPSAVLVVLAVLSLLFSPLALAVLVLPLIAGVVGLLAASVHRWETARDVERGRLSREASSSPGSGAGAGAGARAADD